MDQKFEAGSSSSSAPRSNRSATARPRSPTPSARRSRANCGITINAHIDPYEFGNVNNHDPRRPRKLLLHKHQIERIREALAAGGRTLIPLRLYFKDALIKVELALCTGKKLFDKRDDLKKKVQMREIDRELKNRR